MTEERRAGTEKGLRDVTDLNRNYQQSSVIIIVQRFPLIGIRQSISTIE